MSTTLSLYDLSAELVALMDAWDDPETTPEARVEIETQLRIYAEQHVRKVDYVRAYLRHCAIMEAAALEEKARQDEHAKTWKARAERLKELCVAVMQTFEAKRLDGNTGSLLLKGNGGKQPVRIDNPELVPDEFCVYEGAIPAFVWTFMLELIMDREDVGTAELRRDIAGLKLVRTPRKSLIEAELQKPCDRCQETGLNLCAIPPPAQVQCQACGGSGKRGVSGAYLAERGVHLEVR